MRTGLLIILLMISGYGFGDAAGASSGGSLQSGQSSAAQETYQLLFLGNSHSSRHDLPQLVATLIENGLPGKTVHSALGLRLGFLADRVGDGVTQQMIDSRPWTHVILQAQKYSTSGLFSYPTDAAEMWIRQVKANNALPIMFPEWPRRGNTEEGPRVYRLHLDIASRESACVAPVPLAWDEAIARNPGLLLHASDGNHSSLTGALLTAYVFYQLITGQRAAELPYIQTINVSNDIQQKLREVASFVVESNQIRCSDVALAVDTERLGFDLLEARGRVSQTVTVTSTGVFDLLIDSISEPGSPFSITGGSCKDLPLTLAPSETCTVEIGFSPLSNGLFTGTVAIGSNTAQAVTVINLSGSSAYSIDALQGWSVLVLLLLMLGVSSLFLSR